ncbi:MAG TPA: cell division ATP-binding protein FtsE [Patescibacteria group bacterium]|jgi:cell division transport system ATP-binding protein|nr:cell division ATP-binding protein FtsE [Patescibacteria group bacterium]
MIRLHHVTKSYPAGSTALSDVTLHIEKGEFAFLTGPSGAGKTTLLRLVLREELPTSGSIVVNGRNVTTMPVRDVPYLRRAMGVIFQDFKLIQSKTVLENLTLVQEAIGVPRADHKPRAIKVLKQVSLAHKTNNYPIQLSGGEQQRVAIARALVNEPIILLADEPTGNLDPELASDIIGLLRDINAHGTTVLIATHDREMIRRVGKKVFHLNAGQLVEMSRSEVRAASASASSVDGGP